MPFRYLHWVLKVSASCSRFQQHTIEVNLEMTELYRPSLSSDVRVDLIVKHIKTMD